MTGPAIVLVHGNPETPIIWEPLVAESGSLCSTAEKRTMCCCTLQRFNRGGEECGVWSVKAVRLFDHHLFQCF
jgi:hypothetical protein